MKLVHGNDDKRYERLFRLLVWALAAICAALIASFLYGFMICLLELGLRDWVTYIPPAGALLMIFPLFYTFWLLDRYELTPEGIILRHAFSRECIPWEEIREAGVFAVPMADRGGRIHPYLILFISKTDALSTPLGLQTCHFYRSDLKCIRLTPERLAEFQTYCPKITRYDWNHLHMKYEPAADQSELLRAVSHMPVIQECEERRRKKRAEKRRRA